MNWHVQYRQGGDSHVVRFESPEGAIEAACRLMDTGSDVFGIGTGPLTDSIGRDEIVRIHAMWVHSVIRPRVTGVPRSAGDR